jgi:hemerythrin-like metal-binding protein
MPSFVWEDTFITGVERMDVQHRKIFDYMTTIYDELVDSRKKCDLFNGMLDRLEILCQIHFMEEEEFMEELKYPSAAAHKHQHDLLLAAIDRFKTENNQCHLPDILNDFKILREDFTSHLLEEGMILGEFIKAGASKESTDAISGGSLQS